MIPERSFFGENQQVDARNAEVFVDASDETHVMTVDEQVVRIAGYALGALTVTLPSVAEAKGLTYSIRLVSQPGSEVITIQDKNGDAAFGDLTLTDDEDGYLLWSDGRNWWILASNGI